MRLEMEEIHWEPAGPPAFDKVPPGGGGGAFAKEVPGRDKLPQLRLQDEGWRIA